jgi:hypothetical protein
MDFKTLIRSFGNGSTQPVLRPFIVRWHDEDCGWKRLVVMAHTEDDARRQVEELVNHAFLEVRQAA